MVLWFFVYVFGYRDHYSGLAFVFFSIIVLIERIRLLLWTLAKGPSFLEILFPI